MKKAFLALLALTATSQTVAAQEADWQKITPKLQAALECRQPLEVTSPEIKPLMSQKSSDEMPIWEITPPGGYTVFGLPVEQFSIALGDAEDPAQGLAAYIKGKSLEEVGTAANLKSINGVLARSTAVGELMAIKAHGPNGPIQLGCTINSTAL